MPEQLLEIKGIEECCNMLQRVPREVHPHAMLAGLAAAGKVLFAAIDVRVPVSSVTRWNDETFSEFEDESAGGSLRQDLDITVTLDSEFRGGIVAVGFAGMGYVARFVEYGHHMIGHKPGKRELGDVEPHPFMRPAADAVAEAAVDAFIEAFMEVMTAAGVIDAAA